MISPPKEQKKSRQTDDKGFLIFGLIVAEGGMQAILALFACVCSGVFQAAIIYMIARDAERLTRHDLDFSDLVFFLVGLLGFALVLLVSLRLTAKTGTLCSRHLALRLAQHIRHASPITLEKLGPDPLLTAMTRDLTIISGALTIAFNAVQTTVLLTVSFLMILGHSPVTGVVVLLCSGIMLLFHRRSQKALAQANEASSALEGRMTELLDHSLSGFRELSINKSKRDDLYDNFLTRAVQEVRTFRLAQARCFTGQMRAAHGSWFLFMGVTAFLAPTFGAPEGITTAIVILSFLRTPIVDLASYVPTLTSAQIAVRSFYTLEVTLENQEESREAQNALPRPQPFRVLELQNCCFHYYDSEGQPTFTLGPLNLTIRAGTVTMMTGGNGSGKTTFLKILTGLYPLASGHIVLDGQIVDHWDVRGLFSTVFTDFWLSECLYGLDPAETEQGNAHLQILGLAHKVMIRNNRFTTTALSSGQRRRLALVAALLENRPILLLDEWTADQDPTYRRFFHEELLPELKAQGKTVIAVSHDEAPFPDADLNLSLSHGKIKAQTPGKGNRPSAY